MTHLATALIWIISLASILLMLVRPWDIAEAYWIVGGALALSVSGLIPLERVEFALGQGVNVYLFLAGMMVLAELAREEGVFRWVAGFAARLASGSRRRLFLLIYLAGTAITALLSNDATAVVLTPAVLAVVRRVGVPARPYLFACALVANAASFLLPMSNPANIIVFSDRVPSLTVWLHIFLVPSIVSIVITFLCLRGIFRVDLAGGLEPAEAAERLSSGGKLALAGLAGAAGLLVAASAVCLPLGLPACAAAVLAISAVAWRRPRIPWIVARRVSWAVLALVAGLFVIVEALQLASLLRLGSSGLAWLGHAAQPGARLVAGFAVALLSNAVNNLPIGLVGAAMIQNAHAWAQSAHQILAHAILIGVDLGPNLSVTGSLATILWLIVLRREGVKVTAWQFLKIGVLVMPLALAGSLLCLRG